MFKDQDEGGSYQEYIFEQMEQLFDLATIQKLYVFKLLPFSNLKRLLNNTCKPWLIQVFVSKHGQSHHPIQSYLAKHVCCDRR